MPTTATATTATTTQDIRPRQYEVRIFNGEHFLGRRTFGKAAQACNFVNVEMLDHPEYEYVVLTLADEQEV